MSAGKSKKVYRIYRFKERFEIEVKKDRYRKGPLSFTRDFVGSGGDNESINYVKSIETIWDDDDYHLLHTCFVLLKNRAANLSVTYRGYLLNQRMQPAPVTMLASWMKLDKKTAEKVLRKLIKADLVERVDLPDFDPLEEEPALEPENEDFNNHRTNPDQSGQIRNDPDSFQENGKKKTKRKKKKKVEKEKEKESTPGNGDNPRKKNSDSSNPQKETETKSEPEKGSTAKAEGQKGKGKGKTNRRGKDPTQPETQAQEDTEGQPGPKARSPDPIHPPETDAGGVQSGLSQPAGPVCSDINNRLDDLYNPNAFAAVIFQTLGMVNPTSKNGKSELASFASGWQVYLDLKLSPSRLAGEWDKAVKKAKQISRNRGKCAKPGAVFMGYVREKQANIRGSPG